MFYRSLADLVRQYAGQEALRLASVEDDLYAARLAMGQTREKIESRNPDYTGYSITRPRLAAGDLLIWTSLLLHGNGHNTSDRVRLATL